MRLKFLLALVLPAVWACRTGEASATGDGQSTTLSDSAARARQDSANRAQPGYIIDSALTVEEELRRFRAGIGGAPVSELAGASPSMDSLVTRFARAVEHRDTVEFRAMAVSAREFADIVYPETKYTRPPYRQAAPFVWFQIRHGSVVGLTRLLDRRGGRPLSVVGYRCGDAPERQGLNRIWSGCVLRTIGADGTETEAQFFGNVIERNGRFKFIGFVNGY